MGLSNKYKKNEANVDESSSSDEDVQLFSFNATTNINNGGGRPKRKLKAIARFESLTFDQKKSSSQCKIGEGFSCPRCSAVCSYDTKQCEECDLECYYEAGIGVVVLKERRSSVGDSTAKRRSVGVSATKRSITAKKEGAPATKQKVTSNSTNSIGGGKESMQKVAIQRNKQHRDNQRKRQRNTKADKAYCSTYPTDENDTHISAKAADDLPQGWTIRRIPRSNGDQKDPNWYSPINKYKFKSKPNVKHFLKCLEKTNGDETEAILLFEVGAGGGSRNRGRRKSSDKASMNIYDGSEEDDDRSTKAESQKEMEKETNLRSDRKIPPEELNNNIAKIPSDIHKQPPKKKSKSDDTIASSGGKDLSSPSPPGNDSVRVQLDENDVHPPADEGDRAKLKNEEESSTKEDDLRKDIARLTQQNSSLNELNESLSTSNDSLQSKLTQVTKQRKEQSTNLEEATTTLQAITDEKNDLTTQLSELQAKYDATLSDSSKVETELRQSISDLKENIAEMNYEMKEKSKDSLDDDRDQLAKTVESKSAELSTMREDLFSSSSKVKELQYDINQITAQRSTAEEKVKDLAADVERANEKVATLQSEFVQLGTLKLENEIRLNKSETICAEQKTEIEALKEQASKRMSQIYELTDQLSTALNEKTAIQQKLETSVANLDHANMSRRMSDTHTNENDHKGDEAIAKSQALESTVDELQGQIERLSAELNASKWNHKECLAELERVINKRMSSNDESKYKETIRKLEESINQQNEEMQTLSEAVSTSDDQTADLIAQISKLTSKRDELKTRNNTKTRIIEGEIDVVAAIDSQTIVLRTKVDECIARFESETEEMSLIMAKLSRTDNGINGSNVDLDLQAKKFDKRLTEDESELDNLIHDVEKVEGRMKRALQKFKDKYLATTKGCKDKMKRKKKKIQAMKSDLAKTRTSLSSDEEVQPIQNDDKVPSSTQASLDQKKSNGMNMGGSSTNGRKFTMVAKTFKGRSLANDAVNKKEEDSDSDESTDVQLFALDAMQEYNWDRPKRKLKAIARFESMTFDQKSSQCKIGEGFSCPRCSAVCSYDSKECEDCGLACCYEAGIGVVVLKERHEVKQKSSIDGGMRLELTQHVNCKSRSSNKAKAKSSKKQPNKSQEVQASLDDSAVSLHTLEFLQLLPDGGREYPRELPRVIGFIEAQYKKQEENLEAAQAHWMKVNKEEAKMEIKAQDEERLDYKRGRDFRTRMADQERLGKQT